MKIETTKNIIRVTGTKQEVKTALLCKQDTFAYSFDKELNKPQIFRGDAVFTVGNGWPYDFTNEEAEEIRKMTELYKKHTGSNSAWGFILETTITPA